MPLGGHTPLTRVDIERATRRLAQHLFRVVDGREREVSFEDCYRQAHTLCVHLRADRVEVAVARALRAAALLPESRRRTVVEAIRHLVRYWETRCFAPHRTTTVAELMQAEVVRRHAWAKSTIANAIPVMLAHHYRPGGPHYENSRRAWAHVYADGRRPEKTGSSVHVRYHNGSLCESGPF